MDLNPGKRTRLQGGARGAPSAMRSSSGQPLPDQETRGDAKAGYAFGNPTDPGSNSVPSCVTPGRLLNLSETAPSIVPVKGRVRVPWHTAGPEAASLPLSLPVCLGFPH